MLPLALFSLLLLATVITGGSIVLALLAGLAIFSFHALREHHAPAQIAGAIVQGASAVKNLLVVFALVGPCAAVVRFRW